jgi:putative transposase
MGGPTVQDYRRTGHSVSLLYAHLVFVTKYRRRVFNDAMLTDCEHTLREVCDDLAAELVEFNGEPDHVHLLVSYPPTLAISTLPRRSPAATSRRLQARPLRTPSRASTGPS